MGDSEEHEDSGVEETKRDVREKKKRRKGDKDKDKGSDKNKSVRDRGYFSSSMGKMGQLMHSTAHDSDDDSYNASKHANKRSTRNLTAMRTAGPVSETARWMMGAEPSYDDILREKKRVEAELKWKEEDYNKTLQRHQQVQQRLKAKQGKITFDSRSARDVAAYTKLAAAESAAVAAASTDSVKARENGVSDSPLPLRRPESYTMGYSKGIDFSSKANELPSNIQITRRGVEPMIEGSPEKRYHPRGFMGVDYAGVTVTPKGSMPGVNDS